jgi:hypothetical protein
MSNLFANLEQEAFRAGITPRTKESREWFRNKVKNMRNINRNTLMKDESLLLRNQELVGSMNMFFYDPKTKDTLPFFDRFPLAIVVGPAEGGFYGLNLHYLPMNLRAKFLDALLENMNNKKYDQSTRFRLNYELLQKTSRLRYFKPCFKHYLTAHVKSRFARVPATEWEIATFLPTASWEKASANSVYKFSRSMI